MNQGTNPSTLPPDVQRVVDSLNAKGATVTVSGPVETGLGTGYTFDISGPASVMDPIIADLQPRRPLGQRDTPGSIDPGEEIDRIIRDLFVQALTRRLRTADTLIRGVKGKLAQAGFTSTITASLNELLAFWEEHHPKEQAPDTRTAESAGHAAKARLDAAASLVRPKGILAGVGACSIHEWAEKRLAPSLSAYPGLPINIHKGSSAGSLPTPTPPPAFPQLHWRFIGTGKCQSLGGYLPSDPATTLYEISERDDGTVGYMLDGLTVPDNATTFGETILDLQQTAQRELEAWIKRNSASFPN